VLFFNETIFLASARNIVSLKKSTSVPQIGRFSTPPRVEDLQALTLDDGDIDEIRHCSPGRCDLKLSADEIATVKPLAYAEGPNARAALDRAFRCLLVERARRYLTNGEEYAPREFGSLLYSGPYVRARFSDIATYLEHYPRSPLPGAESFLYWSKETYAWKPMISITHMTLLRGDRQNGAPEATVVSRDIYATRYTSGSFVLTMVFRDVDTPGRHYLVYINRTWVDAMRGLWRPFVEHRVRSQARKVFAATRDRIEQNGVAVSAVR
jgi:hypothetical protein